MSKPTAPRAPDPNRNRTIDVFSEGVEGDADYKRMVQVPLMRLNLSPTIICD